MEQYKALVKHPKQAFSNMFRLNKPHLQVAAGSLEAIFTPANKKQEILTMIKNHQPVKSLTKDQRAYFNRVIRVDQAGELGANYIYAGQYYILSNKYPHLKDVLQHMWDQEIHHHSTFNKVQLKHGVRPSFITPIWTVGAFAMGAGTALISPQAAMACTEAVETVIGGHYNDQLRVLNKFFKDKELLEGEGNYEINEIIETIKQFRDDELEHLDTAIKYDSKKAVPYILLTEGIKTICRVAIFAAERI